MRFAMTEDTARFWATITGLVTAVALVAGGLYTLYEYLGNRATDRRNFEFQKENATFEAKKPFYSAQLDLCEQASSSAAILATSKGRDAAGAKKAEGDFWRLYWGPLGIVEDTGVEDAMVTFGHCLQGSCANQSIENLALSLAHACRTLISQSWNLDLKQLSKKKDD
jgi:hypothetical protein